RFVQREYAFDQRRELLAGPDGFSAAHWATFAELGWLGLLVPEAHGGFGGSHGDVMVLMVGFGSALVVEPYVASAVLATTALSASGNAALQARWLPGLAAGEARAALAYAEPDGRYDPAWVHTVAAPAGAGVRLRGRKSVVLG